MKTDKRIVLAVAVLSGSLALTACTSYNGVKGTVVEREHEICGVELSMGPVAFDIQNTKGGTTGSKGGGTKPKTETKPKVDTTKPKPAPAQPAPAPAPTASANAAGGTAGGSAALVPLIVDKPTPATSSSSKPAKKSKGCKEKYEVEVKDSKGDIHEVKVDRRVWDRCTENKSFPKCAG